MFIPKSETVSDDWERFAKDSGTLDPKDKVRAVILEPGGMFVMEHGLVHAVHTLVDNQICLMTGGMTLNQNDLLRPLEIHFWIGAN